MPASLEAQGIQDPSRAQEAPGGQAILVATGPGEGTAAPESVQDSAPTPASALRQRVRKSRKGSSDGKAAARARQALLAAEDAQATARQALEQAREALDQAREASVAATRASTESEASAAQVRDAVARIKAAIPAPETPDPHRKPDPFSFADFTWLNGTSRQKDFPFDSKAFTGEFSFDSNYCYDFNHPRDHTLVGSTNVNRTNEAEVEQLGIGGDFHLDHVRGRIFTQIGMYATSQPRNDASPLRGQWDLVSAYKYISEAYGGYHWDKWYGINLDMGIFMSYIGCCSYYNYENWIYQMSYVSANTPWYFSGLRLQMFPTERFKLELWLVNGWQSYGMFNESPGVGFEMQWRPTGRVCVVTNEYAGSDTLGTPGRFRFHSDNTWQYKYVDHPGSRGLSKAAFSLTGDLGFERGGGVSGFASDAVDPKQYFVGAMAYNRWWLDRDRFALTLGGGTITNPGRYLVLLPPINGAMAQTGTPYFTQNPGDPFHAWDCSLCLDYMPSQYLTHRVELVHREANVNYFAGAGGITPIGGNTGTPAAFVPGFAPDLRKQETRIDYALLVRM